MSDTKHMNLKIEFATKLSDFVLNYIRSKKDNDAKYIPDVILSSLIDLTNAYASTLLYTKDDVHKAVDALWRD